MTMKTYHEMDSQIVRILRTFKDLAHCQYAAMRIEELEGEVRGLKFELEQAEEVEQQMAERLQKYRERPELS